MAKSRSLTIRLIKSGTRTDQIFKEDQNLVSIDLMAKLPFEGAVHFKPLC
jgi:hypothetical protein